MNSIIYEFGNIFLYYGYSVILLVQMNLIINIIVIPVNFQDVTSKRWIIFNGEIEATKIPSTLACLAT